MKYITNPNKLCASLAALFFVVAMLCTGILGTTNAFADDLGGLSDSTQNSQTPNWDTNNGNSNSNNNGGSSNSNDGSSPDKDKYFGDSSSGDYDSGSFEDLDLHNNNDGGTGLNELYKGNTPLNSESLSAAARMARPIVTVLEKIIALIVFLTFVFTFFTTALDLLYIMLPLVRPILLPNGQEVQRASAGGVGGASMTGTGGWKWVSDEAEAAVNEASAGSVGAANSAMGGSYGRGASNAPNGGKPKSAISIYFRRRAWAVVLLAVSSGLLLSNIFFNLGTTIANWVIDIVSSHI